ncbi:hypothetical protein BH09PSE5_BH09PSE5_26910 [soil metagenome]
MTPTTIAILVALTVYAIYRQSIRHEVSGKSRFKLAIIYAIVGVAVGGFYQPESRYAWGMLIASMLLSIVVGVIRGKYTTLTLEQGKVYAQGTPFTIGMFIALIALKFALGTYEYMNNISSHGGFGEVMLMIAVMVAFQAELIWRRALALMSKGGGQAGVAAIG